MKPQQIDSPTAWKAAMHAQLKSRGISRYAFVREVEKQGICTRHTAECLLADQNTVTGQRIPSFATALEMAQLAGLNMYIREDR